MGYIGHGGVQLSGADAERRRHIVQRQNQRGFGKGLFFARKFQRFVI
jgi:hypothetical protein